MEILHDFKQKGVLIPFQSQPRRTNRRAVAANSSGNPSRTSSFTTLTEESDGLSSAGFVTTVSGDLCCCLSWYVSEGNFLEVYDDYANELVASLAVDFRLSVACCTSCWLSGSHPGLVIALNDGTGKSLVAYFDILSAEILAVFETPEGQATNVEIVLDGHSNVVERKQRLHPVLQSMHQICIVGTTHGHTFLFDLSLADRRRVSDFENPVKLKPVLFHEISFAEGYCVDLIPYFSWNGNYDLPVAVEEVSVSAIKFCDPSAIVAIGLNCGDILLFSLTAGISLTPVRNENVAYVVEKFAVQEPENDPRPTLYLWAANNSDFEDCRPFLQLLQVNFEEKVVQPELGSFYDRPSGCFEKFTFYPDKCERIVSCKTISSPSHLWKTKKDDSSLIRETGKDTSLVSFLWLTETHSLCGGMFDLNAWYLAQMPGDPRFKFPSTLCPFLSQFTLDEGSCLSTESVRDFAILPESLKRFSTGSEQDVFYYPSALSFDVLLACAHGIERMEVKSLQNQIVSCIEKNVTELLRRPESVVGNLNLFGLMSRRLSNSPETEEEMKCDLLDVLLHSSRLSVLTDLVSSSRMDLEFHSWMGREWIWNKLKTTKERFDLIMHQLFDLSGAGLSRSDRKMADHCSCVLSNLETIHKYYMDSVAVKGTKDISELKFRQEAIHLVCEYAQIVLWFLDENLLPETTDWHRSIEEIQPVIFRRRKESRKASVTLFVDSLTEEMRKAQESVCYPPRSFLELLGICLLPGISTVTKKSFVAYFLLDLLDITENDQNDTVSEACDRFCLEFLTVSDPSLFNYVLGKWCADCGMKEKAEKAFLNAIAQGGPCAEWLINGRHVFKHSVAGRAFSHEQVDNISEKSLALKWMRVPESDGSGEAVKCLTEKEKLGFAMRLPKLEDFDEHVLKNAMEEKRTGEQLSQLYHLARHRYWDVKRMKRTAGKRPGDWTELVHSIVQAAQKIIPDTHAMTEKVVPDRSRNGIQSTEVRDPLSVHVNKLSKVGIRKDLLATAIMNKKLALEQMHVASPLKKPTVAQTKSTVRLGKRKVAEIEECVDESVLVDLPHIFATPASAAKRGKFEEEMDRLRESSRRQSLSLFDDIRNILRTPEVERHHSRLLESGKIPTSIMKSARLNRIPETNDKEEDERRHLRFDLPESPNKEESSIWSIHSVTFPKEGSPQLQGMRRSISPIDKDSLKPSHLFREPLHSPESEIGPDREIDVDERPLPLLEKMESFVSTDEDDDSQELSRTQIQSRFSTSYVDDGREVGKRIGAIPDVVADSFLSSDDDEMTRYNLDKPSLIVEKRGLTEFVNISSRADAENDENLAPVDRFEEEREGSFYDASESIHMMEEELIDTTEPAEEEAEKEELFVFSAPETVVSSHQVTEGSDMVENETAVLQNALFVTHETESTVHSQTEVPETIFAFSPPETVISPLKQTEQARQLMGTARHDSTVDQVVRVRVPLEADDEVEVDMVPETPMDEDGDERFIFSAPQVITSPDQIGVQGVSSDDKDDAYVSPTYWFSPPLTRSRLSTVPEVILKTPKDTRPPPRPKTSLMAGRRLTILNQSQEEKKKGNKKRAKSLAGAKIVQNKIALAKKKRATMATSSRRKMSDNADSFSGLSSLKEDTEDGLSVGPVTEEPSLKKSPSATESESSKVAAVEEDMDTFSSERATAAEGPATMTQASDVLVSSKPRVPKSPSQKTEYNLRSSPGRACTPQRSASVSESTEMRSPARRSSRKKIKQPVLEEPDGDLIPGARRGEPEETPAVMANVEKQLPSEEKLPGISADDKEASLAGSSILADAPTVLKTPKETLPPPRPRRTLVAGRRMTVYSQSPEVKKDKKKRTKSMHGGKDVLEKIAQEKKRRATVALSNRRNKSDNTDSSKDLSPLKEDKDGEAVEPPKKDSTKERATTTPQRSDKLSQDPSDVPPTPKSTKGRKSPSRQTRETDTSSVGRTEYNLRSSPGRARTPQRTASVSESSDVSSPARRSSRKKLSQPIPEEEEEKKEKDSAGQREATPRMAKSQKKKKSTSMHGYKNQ